MAANSPEPETTSLIAALPEAVPVRIGPFVLVVDDSDDMRGLISDVLTGDGFDVQTVSSAPQALEVMSARLPDLVITDLLMPGMSGFALRAAMLRRPDLAGVPVVVLSAYWHRPSETLDAVDVLTKPINVDRLIAISRRVTTWPGASVLHESRHHQKSEGKPR